MSQLRNRDPFETTPFAKSYFTRGYKGHAAFRARVSAATPDFRFSIPPEKSARSLALLHLQRVVKDIVKRQVLLHGGAVTNSKGSAFACILKGDRKVRTVRVIHTVGINPLELKVLPTLS